MKRHLFFHAMVCGFVALMAFQAQALETFKAPEEAMEALADAARADNPKQILKILSSEARDIVYSGDAVADKNAREAYVAAYEKKHEINRENEHKAIITIGEDNWPFPIPLVRENNRWHFDMAQGREELLYRRIGRNELNALQVALAYADAQQEYSNIIQKETGLAAYAQRFLSRYGKKDGLYWPAKTGELESPSGYFMAQAAAEGYNFTGKRKPYHGYYYKILTRQGPYARGGKFNYVAQERMIGGFGLIAWPADYKNSGVMSFIMNHEGVVYQKDMGEDTDELAERMSEFNPDDSWQTAVLPMKVAVPQ